MTEIQSEVGSGVGRVDLGSAQGLGAASDAGSQPTHAQTVAGAMDARVGSPARDQAASIGAVTDLDEIFRDFNDPRRKWRRLLAEFVGTFFLVLVAAGAPMMNVAVEGSVSRLAAVVAPGMMVMAVIMAMGKVSGAHLNPAVSIAFALRSDFPWVRVAPYICTQLLGASAAAYFLQFVLGVSAQNGGTYPAGGYGAGAAFLMEFILTFGLVTVILGTASGAQNIGIIGSLGVGAYIALAGMGGSPISGASMNPARTWPVSTSPTSGCTWLDRWRVWPWPSSSAMGYEGVAEDGMVRQPLKGRLRRGGRGAFRYPRGLVTRRPRPRPRPRPRRRRVLATHPEDVVPRLTRKNLPDRRAKRPRPATLLEAEDRRCVSADFRNEGIRNLKIPT